MLKKTATIAGTILLGICNGGAVGWLIGYAMLFFETLPYRGLPPGPYGAATCGISTSIGILTLFVLIPAGSFLGASLGFILGVRAVEDE